MIYFTVLLGAYCLFLIHTVFTDSLNRWSVSYAKKQMKLKLKKY